MVIGFSGTRSGLSTFQRAELPKLLELYKCHEFVHGDCIGADREANDIAVRSGVGNITIFPPDNPNKRAWCFNPDRILDMKWEWQWRQPYDDDIQVRWAPRVPYLERNQVIVNHSEILIACPKEFKFTYSATWLTIHKGWKKAKTISTFGIENTTFPLSHKDFKVIIIPPIQRQD